MLESSFERSGGLYFPKLIYEYFVDEIRQLNDTYTYMGDVPSSKKGVIGLIKEFPKGSDIKVFVNPDDREESVILPGVHWSQFFSFGVISLFLLAVANLVPILEFFFPGCQPNCT